MTWRLTALAAAIVAAGTAAIWGLMVLQHMAATTREELDEFRDIRRAERHVWAASLRLAEGRRTDAVHELSAAIDELAEFDEFQQIGPTVLESEHARTEQLLARRTTEALQRLRDGVRAHPDHAPALTADEAGLLLAAHHHLSDLVDEFERAVTLVHARTEARFRAVLVGLIVLFAVILAAAVAISLLQYRAVIGPLRYIRDGVRRVSGGELATRLAPRGDSEFTDLQADFNRMASELESLCHDLERRVADQSRQLAVSERLASVGFLAAGVAHEINNPLAIMSGHAESVLRRLHESGAAAADIAHDLEIIRDEAFRAKGITQQLLDLSREGDLQRDPVSIRALADEVSDMLRASNFCEHVRIEALGDRDDRLLVSGSAPEIKQVMLNLTMNAAQAAKRPAGRVEISARRHNGWVEVQVRDNGCGMSPETLRHVFEPFFTMRKGRSGVGLGLAISHAIVRRHNGELLAASDGPGRGSVFTLRLPAWSEPRP